MGNPLEEEGVKIPSMDEINQNIRDASIAGLKEFATWHQRNQPVWVEKASKQIQQEEKARRKHSNERHS